MKKVFFVTVIIMFLNSKTSMGQEVKISKGSNRSLKLEPSILANKGAVKKGTQTDKKTKENPPEKDQYVDTGLRYDSESPSNSSVANNQFPMKDILKMQNDKEVIISSFSLDDKKRVLDKFSKLNNQNIFKAIFYKAMFKFLNANDAKCESTFISSIINDLKNENVEKNENDVLDVFKYLRSISAIDDVMYDILEGLTKDYFALSIIDLNAKPVKNIFKDYGKRAEDYDLKMLFKDFNPMPDETTKCGYREFNRLQNSVGLKNDTIKKRNTILKDLIFKAYEDGILDLPATNILKFMINSSTMNKRSIWLVDYVNTVTRAKNKLVPQKYKYQVVNLDEENKFSSERRSRFNKITRRKILYSKYDASQIILLAQVLKKTSQRMGVDPDTKASVPYLIQEFETIQENGQLVNYVERIELDSQSQYNLARRLMRKDILALQMMTSFRAVQVTYDDVVMAALETGYLSLDDVTYVVKYDDLWNAEVSQTEKMLGFTFTVAGYSTFFLPPPWNVAGALALSIIEGVVDSKKIDGASNDNPNTFIE